VLNEQELVLEEFWRLLIASGFFLVCQQVSSSLVAPSKQTGDGISKRRNEADFGD